MKLLISCNSLSLMILPNNQFLHKAINFSFVFIVVLISTSFLINSSFNTESDQKNTKLFTILSYLLWNYLMSSNIKILQKAYQLFQLIDCLINFRINNDFESIYMTNSINIDMVNISTFDCLNEVLLFDKQTGLKFDR